MFDDYMDTGMDIQEEPISDVEAARIRKLIVDKAGKSKKAKREGWPRSSWHAASCRTGVTAFALTELEHCRYVSGSFRRKLPTDNIFPVEEGVSEAGLSVTVRGRQGMTGTFIMMEIARADAMPFTGDNLELAGCSLDADGFQPASVPRK